MTQIACFNMVAIREINVNGLTFGNLDLQTKPVRQIPAIEEGVWVSNPDGYGPYLKIFGFCIHFFPLSYWHEAIFPLLSGLASSQACLDDIPNNM
jgi:hypothetical protein